MSSFSQLWCKWRVNCLLAEAANVLAKFGLSAIEMCLTFKMLLEPKVLSLCPPYRARLACMNVQSDLALYCCLSTFQILILISLKMIMHSSENGSWTSPFRLRVNKTFLYRTTFLLYCNICLNVNYLILLSF